MHHFSGRPLYEISAQSLEDKKETLKTLNFFLESILKIFTLCNLMDHYIIGSFLPYCLYIDVMCKDQGRLHEICVTMIHNRLIIPTVRLRQLVSPVSSSSSNCTGLPQTNWIFACPFFSSLFKLIAIIKKSACLLLELKFIEEDRTIQLIQSRHLQTVLILKGKNLSQKIAEFLNTERILILLIGNFSVAITTSIVCLSVSLSV